MLKGTIALGIAGTIIAMQLQLYDTVMGQVKHIESIMDWGVQAAANYGSVTNVSPNNKVSFQLMKINKVILGDC